MRRHLWDTRTRENVRPRRRSATTFVREVGVVLRRVRAVVERRRAFTGDVRVAEHEDECVARGRSEIGAPTRRTGRTGPQQRRGHDDDEQEAVAVGRRHPHDDQDHENEKQRGEPTRSRSDEQTDRDEDQRVANSGNGPASPAMHRVHVVLGVELRAEHRQQDPEAKRQQDRPRRQKDHRAGDDEEREAEHHRTPEIFQPLGATDLRHKRAEGDDREPEADQPECVRPTRPTPKHEEQPGAHLRGRHHEPRSRDVVLNGVRPLLAHNATEHDRRHGEEEPRTPRQRGVALVRRDRDQHEGTRERGERHPRGPHPSPAVGLQRRQRRAQRHRCTQARGRPGAGPSPPRSRPPRRARPWRGPSRPSRPCPSRPDSAGIRPRGRPPRPSQAHAPATEARRRAPVATQRIRATSRRSSR